MDRSLDVFVKRRLSKPIGLSIFLISSFSLYTFLNTYQIPVFYIPDLIIAVLSVYLFISIKQDVSKFIFVPLVLTVGYLVFSPEKLDIEYNNKYLVTLKPFLYLILFYLFSRARLKINYKEISLGLILLYPIMLLWSIALFYLYNGTFLKRPYFIFENNFEIPLLLGCFIILSFVYKIIDLRIYLLVAVSIILTGSRSGLIGFVLISVPYLFSLNRKSFYLSIFIFIFVLIYLFFIRGIEAFNFASIDRIQTFKGIFNFYNNSWIDLLSYPFGVGIYRKIPLDICRPLMVWAEWFTGNIYNCDPLLLQSYFTRSFYQLGVYVTLLIPAAFFWEIKSACNTKIAILSLLPVLSVALSAGGFSNGLSFLTILFITLSYRNFQNSAHNNNNQ